MALCLLEPYCQLEEGRDEEAEAEAHGHPYVLLGAEDVDEARFGIGSQRLVTIYTAELLMECMMTPGTMLSVR